MPNIRRRLRVQHMSLRNCTRRCSRRRRRGRGVQRGLAGYEERADDDGGRRPPNPGPPGYGIGGQERDDGTHELKHTGDTWPPITKPLDFSDRSEFLVARGHKHEAFEPRDNPR
jgi:hypothetical protein